MILPPSAEAYAALIEAVFPSDRLQEDGGAELPLKGDPGESKRPSEAELQSRWFAGDFGRQFTTTEGHRVEIVQFGTWNHAAGPDFAQTAIDLAGRRLSGSLELDWDARDWERHGHGANPAYNETVLHVFFAEPEGSRFFTRTENHKQVPQIRLNLSALQPLRRTDYIPPEAKPGRCSFPLRDMPAPRLKALLETAARYRLTQKAQRLERIADLHGWDQALFQEVAAALGYRRNQRAMTILAQRLPLQLLQSHHAGAEALLFGAAGYLETKIYESAAPETRDYLRSLWETWWKHRPEFSTLSPPPWVLSGSRPVNHPQRRVGALSQLVPQWRRFRTTLDQGRKPFSQLLLAVEHPYWDWHYTLTSARSQKRLAVIGSTRSADVLANLAYPYWSLRGQEWWPTYASLPAPMENEKSRRAAIRLLGQREGADAFTGKLYQQQALIQIYDDFCLKDHSDCAQCAFPEQLRQW
jgi:Protein of unknown function (DUF2851)